MKHAVVRTPSSSYAQGLTTAGLGPPDLALALRQHERYAAALEACGLEVLRLDPDPHHPDACFVEDVAVVTERGFILTRPGAPSRLGEVPRMAEALSQFRDPLPIVRAPGTLDGGDVCQAEDHFWIGLSRRTNNDGAHQLATWLKDLGFTAATVDIDGLDLLHLKAGMAYLGDGRVAVVEELRGKDAFRGYDLVQVSAPERYAANCVRINDRILIAAGHPVFERNLSELGYTIVSLDMTEFEKMDGGLSCLSLRW